MSLTSEQFHALVSGRARGPRSALLRLGMHLASGPYAVAIAARNRLYDWGWWHADRAPVPVVSVGNLTVGGTGKTPCVEYVARYYRARELRVAILSRGYGSRGGRNDEALVLEANLPDVPHLQGPDRTASARTAVEELESEVLVLDDGFQHRQLARDLDIVVIDATNPWGHGHLLPRGLLRESPSSLRRAGVVLLTRCDQAGAGAVSAIRERVARLAPQAIVAESVHRPTDLVGAEGRTAEVELLAGRSVAAFCGIGNPESFRATLTGLGAEVVAFRTFPDHYAYQRADVDELEGWAAALPVGAMVATTQKDLVKICLPRLGGHALWAVRVGLQVAAGEEELRGALRSILPGERGASAP